jgi:hypothetical protein
VHTRVYIIDNFTAAVHCYLLVRVFGALKKSITIIIVCIDHNACTCAAEPWWNFVVTYCIAAEHTP